ncbi:uncharacterized protein EI90DRAFT_3016921 [Cantharellus anzutake]|uniref:uncharacterized protein n=1 Tax=Cantharellus anzutake TaxID=1750568 RepID=UPI001902D79A|nr:uncharacterized protein EI90DRAFT_3016921 [Cantharellus anzutake]KAF8330201.1 hypothetical protein EI90DRAFT_3016921 [Cantharellus anzutake]
MSLPPTPSPVVAHLSPPDLGAASQLQHKVPGTDDEYIAQEGDFTVIAELDHASVTLGDADREDGDVNRASDDELQQKIENPSINIGTHAAFTRSLTIHLHPMDRLEVVIPSPAHRASHQQATGYSVMIYQNGYEIVVMGGLMDGLVGSSNAETRALCAAAREVGQAQCLQEFGIHVGQLLCNRIGIDVIVKWCPAHSGVVGNE